MKRLSTFLMVLCALLALPLGGSAQGVTKTLFDFQQNNLGLTVGTSASDDGNLSGRDIVNGDVTMRATSGGTMHARYFYLASRGNQLQVLKDGRLRFTAAEGKVITKVEFVLSTTQIHWTVDQGGGTLSTNMKTWEGAASSVRFLGTGTNYIDSIYVTTATVVTPQADEFADVASLADFNALADGTMARLKLTDAQVTARGIDGWTVYVQDATAGAHFYLLDQELNVGDVLNGTIEVTKYTQTNNPRIGPAEYTSLENVTITSGEATAIEGTVADIKTMDNINRLVRLQGVSLTAESGSKATATDASGQSIVVYNGNSGMSPYAIEGDLPTLGKCTVTGILYNVSAGLQIYPLSIEPEADATFDFQNNSGNWPVGEGTNYADGDLTAPLVVGDVTLTGIQGDAYNPVRIMKNASRGICLVTWKGTSLKLNAAEGKAITKVEVTMQSGSFDLTPSNGTLADNVWTGNATEVTFANEKGSRYVWKIAVSVADKNDETIEPVAEVYDVEVENVAQFNALEADKVAKLSLTGARVNAYNDLYHVYYIEDETGATEFSTIPGVQLKSGDVLNGYIIGKKTYNEFTFEHIMAATTSTSSETFTVTEGTLTGTPVEVADAPAEANIGRLLTISNVLIKKEGRFYYAYDAQGNKIQVKDELAVMPEDYEWPAVAESITGVVTFNAVRYQIMPTKPADVVATDAATYVSLFDFAANNMGLTAGHAGTTEETNAGDLGGKSITLGDVTMSFTNPATMPVRYFYLPTKEVNHLQLAVKGSKLRLTAPEGRAIVKVEVVQNMPGSTTNFVKWEVDKGEGTWDLDSKTWTGNATSVRFSATAATYINSISVTTAAATDETVTPAADVYETEVSTLADFAALPDGTLTKLQLTDAVITSDMVNKWGYYVQDATGGAHFYCTALDFTVGDVLNGYVYVTKSTQQAGPRIAMAEDTNADHLTVAAGGTYVPLEGTIEQLNVAANLNRVVKLTGVAVKGTGKAAATITDASGNTISINNASTNYAPYVIQTELTDIDYASATVVGILYGASKTENKIYPLSIEDMTTVGVRTARGTAPATTVYNLQGVKLDGIQKGINIVNGKKIATR